MLTPRHLGRLTAVSTLLGLLLAIGAPPAAAHNGIGAAFKGKAGPYIVYAYDGEQLSVHLLDYRLVVLNAKTKEPVYDVKPRVRATGPAQPTPLAAKVTTFGNVFFYELPNPFPRHWVIHLGLAGPLGTGAVSFRMHGSAVQSTDQTPVVTENHDAFPWAPVIGAAAGLGIIVVLVIALRRRSREAPVRDPASRG